MCNSGSDTPPTGHDKPTWVELSFTPDRGVLATLAKLLLIFGCDCAIEQCREADEEVVEVIGVEPRHDMVIGNGNCSILFWRPCPVRQPLEEPDDQRFDAGDQLLVDSVRTLRQVKTNDDSRAMSPHPHRPRKSVFSSKFLRYIRLSHPSRMSGQLNRPPPTTARRCAPADQPPPRTPVPGNDGGPLVVVDDVEDLRLALDAAVVDQLPVGDVGLPALVGQLGLEPPPRAAGPLVRLRVTNPRRDNTRQIVDTDGTAPRCSTSRWRR